MVSARPKRCSKMLEEFEERARELRVFNALIAQEIAACNHLTAKTDAEEQFKMRTQIRTIFACIESYISHLKQSALLFTIDDADFFSAEERLALSDRESHVTDRGEVRTKRAKIRLKANLRLAFSAYGRATGRDYLINFGDPGGNDFLHAVSIRDRITHPKSAECWRVSEAEAELVIRAWCWFGEHLVAVSTNRE